MNIHLVLIKKVNIFYQFKFLKIFIYFYFLILITNYLYLKYRQIFSSYVIFFNHQRNFFTVHVFFNFFTVIFFIRQKNLIFNFLFHIICCLKYIPFEFNLNLSLHKIMLNFSFEFVYYLRILDY